MRYGLRALLLVVTLLLGLSGCGAGYRYGTTTINYSPDPTSIAQTLPEVNTASSVSTTYHEIRLIDTTGFLMAGLVNASRQYTAAHEAMEDAKDTPDTDDDGIVDVEYSYKPYGIYPGSRVTVDFRVGTDPQLTFDGEDDPVAGTNLSYWGADVVGEFHHWQLGWLPKGRATVFFAARFENVDYEDPTSLSFNSLAGDMTIGSNLAMEFGGVVLVGTVDLGVLTPMFKLLVDSEETHYLNGNLGFEALYYPLQWAALSANAALGRTLEGGRNITLFRAGAGLVVETDFGVN